jgi:hypothetical protein
VSIAKTLDQKEEGTATMAVLKSRFGKDGIVFQDIRFDNAKIQIDMGNSKGGRTYSEQKEDKKINQQKAVNDALDRVQQSRDNVMNKEIVLDALKEELTKEQN